MATKGIEEKKWINYTITLLVFISIVILFLFIDDILLKWIRVHGILDITSYFDNNKGTEVKIPKIVVKNIEYIDPPKIKYIFAR